MAGKAGGAHKIPSVACWGMGPHGETQGLGEETRGGESCLSGPQLSEPLVLQWILPQMYHLKPSLALFPAAPSRSGVRQAPGR